MTQQYALCIAPYNYGFIIEAFYDRWVILYFVFIVSGMHHQGVIKKQVANEEDPPATSQQEQTLTM